MSVESATYINQLNPAWPLSADLISEGDNHIRLEKQVLQNTFPNVAGAVTASHIELSYSAGLTGAIQTQLNGKGAITGQTWTGSHVFSGSVTLPAATTIGTVTAAQISYLSGVTSSIQTQLDSKGSIAGQTWTGTHLFTGGPVGLPANTTIGAVTPTQIGYLSTLTGNVQTQLDGKASKTGDTYTGSHDFTGATVNAATQPAGNNTTLVATTAFVASAGLSSALPGQAGNAGKFVQTDGTTPTWEFEGLEVVVITTSQPAVLGKFYLFNAPGIVLTAPAYVAKGKWGFGCTRNNVYGSVDFGSDNAKGRAPGVMQMDDINNAVVLYGAPTATDGWVQQ